MNIVEYVITSLVWTVAGFVGGLVVGAVLRRENPELPGRSFAAWLVVYWRNLAGLLVLAALTYSIIGGYQATARLQALADCQAKYNEAFAASLAQRSDAANSENDAQRALFDVLLAPGVTQQQKSDATKAYDATLEAAARQRATAPVPPTPRNCPS